MDERQDQLCRDQAHAEDAAAVPQPDQVAATPLSVAQPATEEQAVIAASPVPFAFPSIEQPVVTTPDAAAAPAASSEPAVCVQAEMQELAEAAPVHLEFEEAAVAQQTFQVGRPWPCSDDADLAG